MTSNGVQEKTNLSHYWMPFTDNRTFKKDPRVLDKAEGVYYKLQDGSQVLDGVSGLFCTPLGHGRREIVDRVAEELARLDYCPSFQVSHPQPFQLAEKISELTPGDLNKVFFANSGSEAIDSALKVALAYHRARGDSERQRFVSRERAYHGVNFGGTSLSGLKNNRLAFGHLLPGVVHMRHTWSSEETFCSDHPEKGCELAEDLQRFADNLGGNTIAACIVEPVAGSTGVLLPPRGYLKRLREICDEHGILLIFDEVITGLGRMGAPFASQYYGVTPDMITMAKALTNGMQPMGAVAVSDKIYKTITEAAAATPGAVEFFHGYTFTAHPGACAAALASLEIMERENLFNRVLELSTPFGERVHALRDVCPQLKDIRSVGLLAGLDLKSTKKPGELGFKAFRQLLDAGLLVKLTGDSILLAPPYTVEEKHMDELFEKLVRVLRSL